MLRTVQFACTLPKSDADALNAESGRVYTPQAGGLAGASGG